MNSPFKRTREEMGCTKTELAELLGDRNYSSVIGNIEAGKMRLPDKFYTPLRNLGVDPDELALAQERFIEWRRKFHSCLRWGIVPSTD